MNDFAGISAYLGVGIVVAGLLAMAIKIVTEYERGVVFRLGRLVGIRGPGLVLLIPFIDRMHRVSLRTVVFDVPSQEVITRDNVTCRVNAVVYYRVVDPEKAIVNVERYADATHQISQTTLRSVVGQADLDELLSERDKINKTLQKVIDEGTDPWGIKVSAVEVKDVVIPPEMQRAIARQAEAERDRRAIVIRAEGERQAAASIAEATTVLMKEHGGMTLRMLRALQEVAAEKGTIIVLPVPVEFAHLIPTDRGE